MIDLCHLPEAEREAETARLVTDESRCPFDLAEGPLLRASLLRLRDEEHILVLTTHHIVADAWSMGILSRELWTVYDAYSNEKPAALPDLPIQYGDFAVWQKQWLQDEVLESQVFYWKEQLDGISMLNLPTDGPRPALQSFRGARQSITLPGSLTAAVNELSTRAGVTPFMALLAAFQTLLYRYTGQEDVVVGSPIANRNRTEVEGLIGFFVNTLVLRTDLSGNPTFKELLLKVRDVCLGAYAHQDLPFEKLVQELQPERDLSRNPLFQVMFVLQNAPRPLHQWSGISFDPIEIKSGTSQVDLALFLRERDGKFIGFFEYATDLFDLSTIERMVNHLQTLLEGVVADPNQPISTLPLLTKAERNQLLVDWNDTEADNLNDSCIHELFETQVERAPEAVAVEFEGKELTYRELNSRANHLAHYLRGLGVGPEKLVGICVERSLEMVIGLLGILKTGGAYVPLDPTYPRERLAFMLEDAQVSVLLTQKRFIPNFPRYGALSVCVDDLDLTAHESDENPESEAIPDGAAYVIYTSGSTGTPKGVVGLHRGAVNRFNWMWRTFPFRKNEKSCLKTSLSFVDSVWELFGPLLQGIPTTILSDHGAKDPQLLVRTFADKHVTRIVLVPSLLKAIVDAFPNLQSHLPDLKYWSSSGERLPKKVAERFRKSLPNSILLNLYGSSEVSADVTYYECLNKELGSEIPIGRPISNTQIYLLDSHLQPVPIGVQGELYIGGDGLARGYLNRPELTAEKFNPNHFAKQRGARLYRTGDLARYMPDGNIEFLGRLDNQVKIRGYRIEPGEIEAVLNQHPAIREIVVVALDDVTEEKNRAGDPKSKIQNLKFGKRLVGYIVPTGRPPSVSELRGFLKEKLPDYMIPSAFVMLETVPLTPSGKVDRRALPSPDGTKPQLAQGFVEPRTEIEELVAQIWREVLKLEKVGVRDNFFELGGHSLLGAQIVARLRATFHNEVPLRTLFEAPTVAGLALKIEGTIRGGRGLALPSIVPIRNQRSFPLSMSQEQLWALDQLLPGTHFFNMPYAYGLRGSLNVRTLKQTLKEIIRRHQALRTVFAETNGHPVQVVRRVPNVKLDVVDIRKFSRDKVEEEIARLSGEEASLPFDLTKGPLFKTKLFRLADDGNILLVTMHHIISDRWSMRVFGSELAALYEAFSQGRPSPLPDPPIQFYDFACWERRSMDGELMKVQLAYWKKQLAGPLHTLDFQGKGRRKKRLSFRTSRHEIDLDEKLFSGVKAVSRKENVTPFMVLLAALNVLLHMYTGQRDIRIGTLVANRGRKEIEGLIGHFINTVILRTQLSPKMTFKQLLNQVRNVALAAYAHQELPFEQLAQTLEKQRNIDRASLFQVLFNYQSFSLESPEVVGLAFASLGWQQPRADLEVTLTEFDLIFNLRESSTKLTGAVTYKTDIFDDYVVVDMIGTFYRILEHMVFQPSRAVSTISVDAPPPGRT
jgi:amino acid adenylation domain-containing protein